MSDIRSTIAVTTEPEETRLATLDRIKQELSITSDEYDDLLGSKIDEASADIEAHIARTLSRATLTQTFWDGAGWAEYLLLDRRPVAEITSVTVDDVAVDSDEMRLDGETGQLYRLDTSGYPCVWQWCKSIIVVFAAGYLLPGENDRDLPYPLEAAAIELVTSYWQSRGRDPAIMQEDIPDLGSVRYWVGAVGEAGDLPPGVMDKITPFRRQQI